MFRGFSQLFSKENKDLRKRIYITLFCLGIFCLGTTITIPWASAVYKELGFLEIFNLMSGGGLKSFSIFALGVSPYITASIITQLAQEVIPYFKELKEQGYVGRQKMNKITRYFGILIAFIQAYIICVFYMSNADVFTMLKTSLVMTAGTAFCLWMGDQITEKGIGNGQSMLIMAGIIQSLPGVFKGAYYGFIISGTYASWLGILLFIIFIIVHILIIVGIIWIQLAERRISIQYSNRTTTAYGAQQSFLPLKINSAGVMPVIFASILTTIPATIVGLTKNEAAINFVNKYILYTTPTGFILYIIFIVFFGYFYTFMVMNPEEMSKNLNERGGYIPGIRPGKDTSDYISKSLSRLTIVGSLFLVILAGLPVIFSAIFKLPPSVSIGGTGVLIVVGVAIETYKQMESSLLSRSYKIRRKRLR